MDRFSNPFVILVFCALASLWGYSKKPRSRLPLPPGPKPLPIIGNLFDMPIESPWLVYDRWFKIYGDMIYINVLGQPILILGSVTRTLDLLEKRSTLYSDRVRLPMVNELMGFNFSLATMRYGSWWRRHRKLFHKFFHPHAVMKYHPIQLKESRVLLRRLLVTPEDFFHHIRHAFGATIMKVIYGIQVSDLDDPYILTAEEAVQGASEALVPGKFLVDLIPALKYIPAWVPGAGFKRKAARLAKVNAQLTHRPFKVVKDTLIQGISGPSVVASMLEALPEGELRAEEEEVARNCAGIAYAAGADTTIFAVQSFFLAMAIYPEVQRKAQAELDAVVGRTRLPDFNDQETLPYIMATVKETMRWQNVTPLAFGHSCSADDEYNGYFIPKGTIVMGNAWTILHDPEMYPNPEEFNPDRFLKNGRLNPTIRDPNVAAFGFGRRICPGRYFSNNSLFSVISSVLSVYDISPPIDERGNKIPLKPNMSATMISFPIPFKCVIKPRSSAAEALIRESDADTA